jgi:YHS domain-containing protein
MSLPRDPVCGMEIVDQNAAPQSIFHGDTFYFCEETCKTKFVEHPEAYAGPNPALVRRRAASPRRTRTTKRVTARL